ncbi:MAG: hypothetical protein HUU06_00390 [Planctomycetaceae bacterium]|nr:hypothetical protein [Planctomycetaceae bacterium]
MIGTTATYSDPMDVRAYATATLVAWQGTGLGGTPASVEYTVQQSLDLENWVDIGTVSPAAGSEETLGVGFTFAWMRVKAVVSGSDPGVTTWLKGEFVTRDESGGGQAA